MSWQTWALMIYTGVAINGVAVVLMYDAMEVEDTAVAAAFTALTPVSGAFLSVALLGERFHLYHLAGITLAAVGVFVVAREAMPSEQQRCTAPSKVAVEVGDARP